MPLSPEPSSVVLASPDRVVFRSIPTTLAPTNKRVTLSSRRPTPTFSSTSTLTEPGTTPLNTLAPNSLSSHRPITAFHLTPATPTTPVTPPTSILTNNSKLLFHKNGLPIKSALKSPLLPTDPSMGRPLSFRSHSSPALLSSPKYVHFNAQLEHIRLFLKADMPSCVANQETIVDVRHQSRTTSNLTLTLTNWSPISSPASFQPDDASPLRVESIDLSKEQTEMQGKVLIHNLAFHKHVSVRYTIDYWQTQTEVMAEYQESIAGTSLDRFTFTIPVDMTPSVAAEKTFCFAVRYQVNGREFWDSNNGMNYQLECKRVVVEETLPKAVDLSKQMNTVLLASRMSDYNKPMLKKKTVNTRYDLSTSLSAAQSRTSSPKMDSIPVMMTPSSPGNQSPYRPSEYITPVQSPPGYHPSLYASSPKFVNSYLSAAASPPEHFHLGFDQLSLDHTLTTKRGTRQPWMGNEVETGSPAGPTRSQSYPSSLYGSLSAPISIPSTKDSAGRPSVGSSSYFDLVDRYCFYESTPHKTSPYSSYSNSPNAACIRG